MEAKEKKKEILKAASNCFARYGFDKTTLDDIGRLVGLNKASLYYYYKNKESIFTDVIYFEGEEFLSSIVKEVEKVRDCKEKILTYLTRRLDFISAAINLNKLSVQSMQIMMPFFDRLYTEFLGKETEVLSDILLLCIKSGELKDCETKRIAKSILTITEAIKNKAAHCADINFISVINSSEVLDEIVYTVSLIIDGLKANKE